MKKISALFSVLALCGLSDAAVSDNYTYEIANGQATITDVSESISGVVSIPSTLGGAPVVAIGDEAFRECTKITKVTIPYSITHIGRGAFFWCMGLEEVTLPESVTEIGDFAFYSCRSLENVITENGLPSVGESVFNGCDQLQQIHVAQNVTEIEPLAFYQCTTLDFVDFTGDYPVFGPSCFDYIKSGALGQYSVLQKNWTKGEQVGNLTLNPINPLNTPISWFTAHQITVSDGDYVSAIIRPSPNGKKDANGEPVLLWHDYLTGTDPNNPNDLFYISNITVHEDDSVDLEYAPDLKSARRYVVEGKSMLTENWSQTITPETRFFRMRVEMP